MKTKMMMKIKVKPCIDCNIMIDEDVWTEELGMCIDCSNKYWSHEDE
jgi:hypothetical protein